MLNHAGTDESEALMTVTAARQGARSRLVAFRLPRAPSSLVPYFLVGPALVCLVTFSVLSIFVAAAISLTNLDIGGLANFGQVRFIGLGNYQTMFSDPAFWEALGNTAFFVLVGVPTLVIGSLIIAVALKFSRSSFFLALLAFYFFPAITAIRAISFIWCNLSNSQFWMLIQMRSCI